MGDRVNHRSLVFGTATVALAAMSTTAWADQPPQPKSTAATKTNPVTGEPEAVEEPAAPEKPTPEKRPEKYDPETSTGKETKFTLTPYGLGQAQVTHDSTQSFQHGQGNNAINRSGAPTLSQAGQAYAGQHGRLSRTAPRTITGFLLYGPPWPSVTGTGRVGGRFG